jgi:membrane-bound ClpP family serine protease
MTELRNTDGGRILLGLLILAIGAFLVLINLQLSSFKVVGLWPLFLIVPGAIMLSMVIIVSPPQTRPLRPLHGESSYPDQFHQGPLVW